MMVNVNQVARWTATEDGQVQVCSGTVWLTRDGDADDHVLGPGDSLLVWAGDQLTAEPWQRGQAAWLLASPLGGEAAQRPAGRLRGATLRGTAGLARGLAGGLLALARNAEAMASRAHGSI
jgi:hypothetical protein